MSEGSKYHPRPRLFAKRGLLGASVISISSSQPINGGVCLFCFMRGSKRMVFPLSGYRGGSFRQKLTYGRGCGLFCRDSLASLLVSVYLSPRPVSLPFWLQLYLLGLV